MATDHWRCNNVGCWCRVVVVSISLPFVVPFLVIYFHLSCVAWVPTAKLLRMISPPLGDGQGPPWRPTTQTSLPVRFLEIKLLSFMHKLPLTEQGVIKMECTNKLWPSYVQCLDRSDADSLVALGILLLVCVLSFFNNKNQFDGGAQEGGTQSTRCPRNTPSRRSKRRERRRWRSVCSSLWTAGQDLPSSWSSVLGQWAPLPFG